MSMYSLALFTRRGVLPCQRRHWFRTKTIADYGPMGAVHSRGVGTFLGCYRGLLLAISGDFSMATGTSGYRSDRSHPAPACRALLAMRLGALETGSSLSTILA